MNPTEEERAVLAHLAAAWNAYIELPRHHDDDIHEFRHALHRLQHLVMIRPIRLHLAETRDSAGD